MEVCEMNFTGSEYYENGGGSNLETKIIGLAMYVIGCFGLFLFLGIIHYEKFGQDSQKRSFPDRIFTFNCIIWMVGRFVYSTISEISWFFGPVGYGLTSLRYYVGSSQLCIPLGVAESVLFRCLMIFSWKTATSINDEFVSTFFAILNFIVAQMISVIRLMFGQFHHKDYFILISGVDKESLKETSNSSSFRPWIIVAIFYMVIVTICVLGQSSILIKKFIERYKERQVQNNVNVMIQNNHQPSNNAAVNNAHWNHQICNNYGLLALISTFLVFALSQFVWGLKWNHWMLSSWPILTLEEKAHIYDNIEFVVLTLGIPIIIYVRNEKMRKHLLDEIRDICA